MDRFVWACVTCMQKPHDSFNKHLMVCRILGQAPFQDWWPYSVRKRKWIFCSHLYSTLRMSIRLLRERSALKQLKHAAVNDCIACLHVTLPTWSCFRHDQWHAAICQLISSEAISIRSDPDQAWSVIANPRYTACWQLAHTSNICTSHVSLVVVEAISKLKFVLPCCR